MPTYNRIYKNTLFLTEFRMTDAMSKGLNDYLAATKSNPIMTTKFLYVDDC